MNITMEEITRVRKKCDKVGFNALTLDEQNLYLFALDEVILDDHETEQLLGEQYR